MLNTCLAQRTYSDVPKRRNYSTKTYISSHLRLHIPHWKPYRGKRCKCHFKNSSRVSFFNRTISWRWYQALARSMGFFQVKIYAITLLAWLRVVYISIEITQWRSQEAGDIKNKLNKKMFGPNFCPLGIHLRLSLSLSKVLAESLG